MTADRWTRMVRQQVGLGRILPLGGRHDGVWIAERAAGTALRRAAEREVPEVRVDGLRLGLADDLEEAPEPAVPAPPSALPPGPLRLTAEFAATAAWPLPETASRLRTALAVAAAERVGLAVEEVDLRVTELLDTEPDLPPTSASDASDAPADRPETDGTDGVGRAGDAETERVAAAVLAVPGVSRLTGTWGRPVRLSERPAGDDALPRRHARVDLAVGAEFRPLEVARAVRAAVAASLPDRPTVAVLVTDLD
ncbi:hypothetical protein [Streptomyces sp. NPDC006147]|uniref:hypothetical protein n=1 Tax=unclassified Streptomyces TaxID=2593676 RepID=UPI0033ABC96B